MTGHISTTKYQNTCAPKKNEAEAWPRSLRTSTTPSATSAATACSAWPPTMRLKNAPCALEVRVSPAPHSARHSQACSAHEERRPTATPRRPARRDGGLLREGPLGDEQHHARQHQQRRCCSRSRAPAAAPRRPAVHRPFTAALALLMVSALIRPVKNIVSATTKISMPEHRARHDLPLRGDGAGRGGGGGAHRALAPPSPCSAGSARASSRPFFTAALAAMFSQFAAVVLHHVGRDAADDDQP